ncbi:MAG TPA: peroxiredoxin [Turneriella sp.]|nr:peroxiredoxin [Turneriella sp.]HMY10948.1 peroxiredoxin [Turneriella sp.]HNE18228.1 peroxiredoxin [Turneriella sp.]HNJ65104.1 peroxiredoxin [Turneriella sp.]HNL09442.1 peroxiredoxin [Turneriella sp.]
MLETGKKIPASLTGILVGDGEPKKTKLSELYKDKTLVLYFYPKDNTPGCTTEAVCFRDNSAALKKAGLLVVGCSRDNEKAHKKFIADHDLNFPLLYDDTGKITEAFGVWAEKSMYGKKYMGILRSTFVIEKSGKIAHVFEKVSVKTHALDILKAIKG